MKLLDVVTQLKVLLPKYTSLLSNSLSVSTIVVSGGTATVSTSTAHGLSTGALAVMANVLTHTEISSVSQDGLVFTFETTNPHDLTYGWSDHEEVDLSGFTDTDWNDSFELVGVPNRNEFKVRSTNTIPTLNGNEILLELRDDGVNGRHQVTVTGSQEFTFSGVEYDATYSGGSVNTGVRVAGSVNLEEAFEQYTKKNLTALWCFVVMNDVDVSKDRSSYSDATSAKTASDNMRLRLIDGFTVTYIKNTTQDMLAVDAVDIFRHDLLLPTLKSVYGARFDTGLSCDGDFKTVLTGHGAASFNRATFAYTYAFETIMDATDEDAVEPAYTRAFRDINYTIEGDSDNDDVQDMTVIPINLDEEP